MISFRTWLEADETLSAGGQAFWGDSAAKGKVVAAGVMPIANDTGRICLSHRSNKVNNWIDGKSIDLSFGKGKHHLEDEAFAKTYMQGCYGNFGGALGGNQPEEAAKKETHEECGFAGPWLKFTKAHTWSIPGTSLQFQNFIGVIPHEKELTYKPDPASSWESYGIKWVDWEEIKGKNGLGGIRFHDGFRDLIASSGSEIDQIIEQIREKNHVGMQGPQGLDIKKPQGLPKPVGIPGPSSLGMSGIEKKEHFRRW